MTNEPNEPILSPADWRYRMLGAKGNDRTHDWLVLERHDAALRALVENLGKSLVFYADDNAWENADSDDLCDHGVTMTEHCDYCAHRPDVEWVGYPMTVCAWERVPWPCEFEENRRKGAEA